MPIDYGTISTETMPSQIARMIRASILDGRLGVNERLPTEEDLAARFGVSRPTIREALKRLAAQNLVRSRRGPAGGTFVAGPNIDDARADLAATTTMLVGIGQFTLEEIAEVRRALETLCVRLAAANRSDDDLAALADEIELQKGPDLTDMEFCASDVRFHRRLADAAGNELLGFLMGAVVEALQPISNLVVFRYRDRREIAAQHAVILDHLRFRNAEGAVAAVARQIDYLKDRYERAQAATAAKAAAAAHAGQPGGQPGAQPGSQPGGVASGRAPAQLAKP